MMKTFTIVAAFLAGGVSLAIAQGQPTGNYPPVAGGAGGGPSFRLISSWSFSICRNPPRIIARRPDPCAVRSIAKSGWVLSQLDLLKHV
jgi:hypothetical protein